MVKGYLQKPEPGRLLYVDRPPWSVGEFQLILDHYKFTLIYTNFFVLIRAIRCYFHLGAFHLIYDW